MTRRGSRFGTVLGIVGIAASIGACGGGGGAATAPAESAAGGSAETSPSGATTTSPDPSLSSAPEPSGSAFTFTSERYGYALELPAGWYLHSEAPGRWTTNDISYIGAGTDSFEEDYEGRGEPIGGPGITYGLYVSAAELSGSTDVETWTDELAKTMLQDSSCQGAPEREQMTIDGEPAIALVYDRADCTHDHHVVVVGVVHESMGYDLLWLAKRGEDDARRGTLESILETVEWTN